MAASTTRERYGADLRKLPPDAWPAYLTEHSGLPGPRGNLELVAAVADQGDREMFDALVASDDEYLVVCGTVGWGRLVGEHVPDADELVSRLHALSSDERWRVREAVAMALQRFGDADLPRMQELVRRWAGDRDPLVQRAAVAGICEPRLLRSPADAAVAVDVCDTATAFLAARPATERRRPGVRTLRQGLGYAWSVAVAADPAAGLPRFEALRTRDDPDVAWIVRENLRKARLARLLPSA